MKYLVVGAGVAAVASAQALLADGHEVVVTDRKPSAALTALGTAGAVVVVADPPPLALLDGTGDVIVSPGVPPHDALAAAAVAGGHDVYSEPELAWRRRQPGGPPWLGITGTNGKTTTTTMTASILGAAGKRTAALGNIGVPLVGADDYDVLAVELTSFQMHWSSSLAPQVGAILNFAPDHLEWHLTYEHYTTSKLAIWRSATPDGGGVAIGNLDDPAVAAALADVTGRAIGFTLGEPKPGQLGVIDGVLTDWAFSDHPVPLIEAALIRQAGAHNVSNALAAAAVTLAYGVTASDVYAGLAGYQPEPHRNAPVATVAGVGYVDDSKATNPHAAQGSLLAYPSVVWIAGGQLKGVDIGPLVAEVAHRLRGAVLIGIDRASIAAALARHAPDVPVVDVATTDDGAMGEAVRAAAAMAAEGDTVLLAPAAASKDMYHSYAHRGTAFADAVAALGSAAS